jgi:hypothetical protein
MTPSHWSKGAVECVSIHQPHHAAMITCQPWYPLGLRYRNLARGMEFQKSVKIRNQFRDAKHITCGDVRSSWYTVSKATVSMLRLHSSCDAEDWICGVSLFFIAAS